MCVFLSDSRAERPISLFPWLVALRDKEVAHGLADSFGLGVDVEFFRRCCGYSYGQYLILGVISLAKAGRTFCRWHY